MVFTCEDYPYTSKSGICTQVDKRQDYERIFLQTIKAGHQIFICNIFSDQYLKKWSLTDLKSQKQQQFDLDQCFIVSDMSFTSSQFPHISPWINYKSFEYLQQKNQLQRYIQFLIQYCGYLGIKCLTIPFRSEQVLCQILNKLEENIFKAKLGIIIKIRLTNDIQWEKFIQFRKNLNSKVHISLILEFTANIPPRNMISKWMAQRIDFLSFSKECYVMNNKGNPVLPLVLQNLTFQFFKLKAGFLYSMSTQEGQNSQFESIDFFRYVNHLFQIMAKKSSKRQISARGLYEILQHPLQPYADNLQSQTYSIFQYDAPKYEQYAVAILLAFQKINITNRNIIVYYLGSGRGALIPGIISASKATKRKVTIYAVQKNPFPLQSLKRRIKQNKWSNIVKIVKTDIKSLVFEQKPDIFFSELLGGFGDNQLSPECLKWAQDKLQDKQNLICIPTKYSSFIKPVCYPFIHRSLNKHEKQSYFTVNFGWHYSPFKSKQVWEFNHPLPKQQNEAFSKKSVTEFQAPQNITIHGFLGSFNSNLYDSSYFSIVPQTQTIDMYSWFPIYFTFIQEEFVQKGYFIQILLNRFNFQNRVWYQWSYQILDNQKKMVKKSKIHNKNGHQKCIYL